MLSRLVGAFPAWPVVLGGVFWGAARGFEDRGVRAVHAALDVGINMIDTARAYTTADHEGYSEQILARALQGRPDEVLVATKGGLFREGDTYLPAGRPEVIRQHCETSLRLLQTDCLDLFQLHTVDPEVPLAETMGAFADLKAEGKIRYVGLSNVSGEQLTEAQEVVAVDCVQNHLSPLALGDLPTARRCADQAIAYLAYAPLGGGGRAKSIGELHPALSKVAAERDETVQQIALAWLLHLSPNVLVITGATTPESVKASAAAAELVLSASELAELERNVTHPGR